MELDSKILILGGNGMVGKALIKLLANNHYTNLLYPTSKELDLTSQENTNKYFKKHKPEYVFHLAAKVGGIQANIRSPAEFGHSNLLMALSVIHSAHEIKVKKLLYVGSSCIYPKNCQMPIKEEYLMQGECEKTNESYALAKIVGLKLCESYAKQYGDNFISVMPCNLYGDNDNFNPITSHVVSGMINKFSKAKSDNASEVVCWGDGSAKRELMYVDDVANGLLFCMDNYNDTTSHINIGTGKDVSMKELAETVKNIVGYTGKIVWDASKPAGMLRRVIDVSKLNKLGWEYTTELEEGIQKTYNWYKENIK